MPEGRLFAVVGPSGVGKDTVLRLAVERLSHVALARRVITRAADEHEDHEPATLDAFREREAAGDFCATWDAHGLRYGVPERVRADVAAGRRVLLNASRGALGPLLAAIPRTTVVELTAPAAERARRLAERGREDACEIERRLARARLDYPERAQAVAIDNGGPAERAAAQLVALVEAT